MRVFDSRLDMMTALVPRGGAVAEVGTFEGEFARCLLDALQPSTLLLIDPWEGVVGSGDEHGNGYREVDMPGAYGRLAATLGADPRVLLVRAYSADAVSSVEDGSLDAVYIDGDHSYEGVKNDLRAFWPKVRPGGIIAGHDYEMNMQRARTRYEFGVKRAVDEFLEEKGVRLAAKAMDGCVSFAFQKPA